MPTTVAMMLDGPAALVAGAQGAVRAMHAYKVGCEHAHDASTASHCTAIRGSDAIQFCCFDSVAFVDCCFG